MAEPLAFGGGHRWLWPTGLIAGLLIVGISYGALLYRPVDAEVRIDERPPQPTAPPQEQVHLRVGVATMLAPLNSHRAYRSICQAMADGVDRPLKMVIRNSYAEVNDLLRQDKIDMAFVCSGGYMSAPDAMDVLATPLYHGRDTYQALVIVPHSSPAQAVGDLEGRRFLFTDPDSLTGYKYLRHRLEQRGTTPRRFFGEIRFSGGHDRSVVAVAGHAVDGASVGSPFYDFQLRMRPELEKELRVIENSPPFPNPPIVVRKSLPDPLRKRVLEVLLSLPEKSEVSLALDSLGISSFVPASNARYGDIFNAADKPSVADAPARNAQE